METLQGVGLVPPPNAPAAAMGRLRPGAKWIIITRAYVKRRGLAGRVILSSLSLMAAKPVSSGKGNSHINDYLMQYNII